jgi:hypothetical protein
MTIVAAGFDVEFARIGPALSDGWWRDRHVGSWGGDLFVFWAKNGGLDGWSGQLGAKMDGLRAAMTARDEDWAPTDLEKKRKDSISSQWSSFGPSPHVT